MEENNIKKLSKKKIRDIINRRILLHRENSWAIIFINNTITNNLVNSIYSDNRFSNKISKEEYSIYKDLILSKDNSNVIMGYELLLSKIK